MIPNSEYHKIDTIFERDPKTFIVDPSKPKHAYLSFIKEWDVTEKIDGTNVRVMFDGSAVSFAGRSDNAQMHPELLRCLAEAFTPEKMRAVFPDTTAVLYGEGYGAGIQKGGLYRADKGFILFDVLCAGKWWLEQRDIEEVAQKLGIECVPFLGRMALDQIIDLVRQPFASKIGTAQSEGIVARPPATMFDRNGRRVIIKLKTVDFVGGRRLA